MSNQNESEILKAFRQRIARGDLSNVEIKYHVSGGAPGERYEEEITINGKGDTSAKEKDQLESVQPHEASSNLNEAETKEIFNQLGSSVDKLVTRSEALFPPDSIVKSVTIRVDNRETTLFYSGESECERVSPESTRAYASSLPSMPAGLKSMEEIGDKLLHRTRGERP